MKLAQLMPAVGLLAIGACATPPPLQALRSTNIEAAIRINASRLCQRSWTAGGILEGSGHISVASIVMRH